MAADLPADARRTGVHIPSLDGLRACSFLLVFAGHAGLERYVPGGFGVTIFFFLSGFLITTLLRIEYERNGRVDLRNFWLRRALRILPPFYVVLLGVTLATVAVTPAGTVWVGAVAARALHVTNYWLIYRGYGGEPAGTGVYWSLAVEEHFYVVFPFLYVGLQRSGLSPKGQALTFWGLCAVVLLWRYVLVVLFHAPADRTYLASDTRIDSILFGCALAVWRNPALDESASRERAWKRVIVPCSLLVLGLCLVVRDSVFRETLRYSLQGAALTGLFAAAIRFNDWSAFRFLNWQPMVFLGALSYSLYLLHYAVILAVEGALPSAAPSAQASVAFGISVGLAWIMYVTIELPCARLRKKLQTAALNAVRVLR